MTEQKKISAFDRIEKRASKHSENFVKKSLDISDEVYDILKSKGWSQKDLAIKLGKTEAEISKWLSGLHNLTIKSITKMEEVLGEEIIMTKSVAKDVFEIESALFNSFRKTESYTLVKPVLKDNVDFNKKGKVIHFPNKIVLNRDKQADLKSLSA